MLKHIPKLLGSKATTLPTKLVRSKKKMAIQQNHINLGQESCIPLQVKVSCLPFNTIMYSQNYFRSLPNQFIDQVSLDFVLHERTSRLSYWLHCFESLSQAKSSQFKTTWAKWRHASLSPILHCFDVVELHIAVLNAVLYDNLELHICHNSFEQTIETTQKSNA